MWKCLPSQPSTLQEVRYDLALDKHSSDGLSELSKIQQLKGDHTSFCSFDEFRSAINSIEFGANKPDILDGGLWIQDREFGRQMLNGTNPSVIKLCVELPNHFQVTDAILQGLLTRSWTLKTEMKVHCEWYCLCVCALSILKCMSRSTLTNDCNIVCIICDLLTSATFTGSIN